MVSFLEIILCVTVLLAAAISMRQGWVLGVTDGAEAAIEVMVQDGQLSRFINDDGDVEVCSSGVMNEICPKCGYQEGDECESPT